MAQMCYNWLLMDAFPPSFHFGGSPYLRVNTQEQVLTTKENTYLNVNQIFLTEFSSFPFSHSAYVAMSSFCRDLLELLFISVFKKKGL